MNRVKAEAAMAAYRVGGMEALMALATRPKKKDQETVGRWEAEAVAAALTNGWEILDVDGNSDYQGWGVLLLKSEAEDQESMGPPRTYTVWGVLAWSYGSCSGCDSYEGLETEDVIKELGGLIQMYRDEESAKAAFGNGKGW